MFLNLLKFIFDKTMRQDWMIILLFLREIVKRKVIFFTISTCVEVLCVVIGVSFC